MANGTGHSLMTKVAYEVLPEWEQEFWNNEKKPLITDYCMYGDSYFGSGREEAAPYMEMPNGENPMKPWTLRTFTKKEFGDYFTCGYYQHVRYVLEYYIARISENLRMKKTTDAAKFAGVLAHFIEDSSCPPHAMGTDLGIDLYLIKRLLPPPNKQKKLKNFHCALENEYKPYSLNKYVPMLMGTSPEEAAFRLFEKFTDMLENSIGKILPMVTAFYQDDYAELKKHLTLTAIKGSEMLADAWHTAFCIAHQRFQQTELEALKQIAVNSLTPSEQTGWAPSPYFYPEIRNVNVSLAEGFEPVDLALNVDGKTRKFINGIGIGSPFYMTYSIPAGTYKYFKSFIGLHPKLNNSGGKIIFEVQLDKEAVFNSGWINNLEARQIEVELNQGSTLTLSTISCSDDKFVSSGQAVWGEPKLVKK